MFKNFFIGLALNSLSSAIRLLGIPTLNEIMVALGKAFGPDRCRHFSELSDAEQKTLVSRAPILTKKHTDWPKAFQWVPRSLTCYVTPGNKAPEIIYGTGSIEDIPEPGTYVATRGYVGLTTKTKLHMRAGFRWDRVDLYLEFPAFTVKQLK